MSAIAALLSNDATDGIGGMSSFSLSSYFNQPHGTAELNTDIEMNQGQQLIVDIAIAELQMDSGSGMVCSTAG